MDVWPKEQIKPFWVPFKEKQGTKRENTECLYRSNQGKDGSTELEKKGTALMV